MRQVFLRRITSGTHTFGVLIENEIPIVVTLELPELNNKKNESCIPDGPYICKRDTTGKYNNTFEVTDVDGRTEIEFHIGNRLKDTKGCILTGLMFGELHDEPAVLSSEKAFNKFVAHFKDVDKFALTIQNSYLYGGV